VSKLPVTIRSPFESLQLTQARSKRLDTIHLVREQRENRSQDLAFHARPFILCGIPLRRPPTSQLVHTRHNGKFSLQIVGHPQFGLPYGQDRLVPIWVATLAVRQKSRVVHFSNAAEMLSFFRLSLDGCHYRRLVQAFQRVFAATIFLGSDERPEPSQIFDWDRFHFFDQVRLWFNPSASGFGNSSEATQNTITLSQAFYGEIDQHRIPVEREAVAALANAPGLLDFYLWIVWKSWTVHGQPARVPLFGPSGLCEQLGTEEYSEPRFFRRKIHFWLRHVSALWPYCPARISQDGKSLTIYSSRHAPAICGLEKSVKLS